MSTLEAPHMIINKSAKTNCNFYKTRHRYVFGNIPPLFKSIAGKGSRERIAHSHHWQCCVPSKVAVYSPDRWLHPSTCHCTRMRCLRNLRALPRQFRIKSVVILFKVQHQQYRIHVQNANCAYYLRPTESKSLGVTTAIWVLYAF